MSDIFEETNNSPVIDPDKDYFVELVGEDKKYKDTKAVGRALVEKDVFIEQLKKEAEEARTELRSRLTVEEMLDQMRNSSNTSNASNAEVTSQQETVQTNKETILPEDIDKLVEQKLLAKEKERNELEAKQRSEANLNEVKTKLTELYGPNYAASIKQKAQELGVTTEFLTETAAREPKALFKLLDISEAKPQRNIFEAPVQSAVNTSAMNRVDTGERTQSFYDKLKKSDPKRYWSAEVQSQRHKDALRLGERFFA